MIFGSARFAELKLGDIGSLKMSAACFNKAKTGIGNRFQLASQLRFTRFQADSTSAANSGYTISAFSITTASTGASS